MNRRDFLKLSGVAITIPKVLEQLVDSVIEQGVQDGMRCDACGKNMTTPNGEVYFCGVQIEVLIDDDMDEPSKQWYDEQMKPYQVNRQYHVCFPCWLRSLGVRP